MSDPVEEVGEIRRILRVGGSRKRSRTYFIRAALHADTPPKRPTSASSDGIGPDCVIDISGPPYVAAPTRRRASGVREPDRATVSADGMNAADAGKERGTEEKRTPRVFWGEDPVALTALGVLGLDRTAALSEVKKRWRRLAQRLHPDKGGDAEVFIRARIAYETLIGRPRSTER